jgi:uncharacterized protein involved in exopolysaccharide biosynthesis
MNDILRLVKILIKHLPVILGCGAATAILVILFTINMPKEYVSESIVYTGLRTGVNSETIITNRQDPTANYAFDNLLNIVKSRETLKETGLRLVAYHMSVEKADPRVITDEHLQYVRSQMPANILQLKSSSVEGTYRKLAELSDTHPYLIALLNYPAPYYSIPSLSNVNVTRITNSDMVKLEYASDDQGISQKTLEILIDVSLRNFRKITESQTDTVVFFFEKQLAVAEENLRRAEEKDLLFKKTHNLVNYEAQTEIVITQRKEVLDMIYAEQSVLSSSKAVIDNLERQLGTQAQNLKNGEILNKREQLGKLSNQFSTAQLNNASPDRITVLQAQINQVKKELDELMVEASNSPTGSISNDALLSEYFSKIIAYEESNARLKALEERRNEAIGQYDRFLPLGDELKRIQREIEISEKTYLAALDNLYQSKRRQQNNQTIQVLDKPNYPLTAKPSNRKLLVVLGAMVGSIIPAVVFLFIAFLDDKIRTIQRAEELTGLKSGGIFPNTKILNAYKNSGQISDGLSDTILKNIYLTHNPGQQRILIISTRPSEGKTTISNLLCERVLQKGKKCVVVVPYLASGGWSVVSYKVDNAFFQSKAEDLVPVDKLNSADVLILELPSLIMNDYPVALIKQFNIAFLVCDANREWTKADQTALDGFVKISGITPYLILNDVNKDAIEEVLGKI